MGESAAVMAQLSKRMEAAADDDRVLPRAQLLRSVAGRPETVARALEALVESGHVVVAPGRAAVCVLVRPFRVGDAWTGWWRWLVRMRCWGWLWRWLRWPSRGLGRVVVVGDEVVEVRVVERASEPPAESEPELVALWRVVQRVSMAQVESLVSEILWQITESDWEALGRQAKAGVIGFDVPSGRSTLFGVPVAVIGDERGRWPELVLVVDRRV